MLVSSTLSARCFTDESTQPPPTQPQLWNSTDLESFTYVHPITPGGPGGYWELPYVLPFHANGSAIDNYHHASAAVHALLFGHGNAYYVGHYDPHNKTFAPLGVAETSPQVGLPEVSLEPKLPLVVGSWPLTNGSGAATVGPTAVLTGTLGAGTGTEFFSRSAMAIPFFRALQNPTANGGLALSFRVQLNPQSNRPTRATVFGRADDVWGVEWWGGTTLNFWVRGGGESFRAVQAQLCASECERRWVRVAVTYDANKPFDKAISMAAAGRILDPIGSEPGTHHGRSHWSTSRMSV